MSILNIEFKASTNKLVELEALLQKQNPLFIGEDHQVDTYFNILKGRLKLREGNIENALIHYEREDFAGAKSSHVLLYQHQPDKILKEILIKTLGVKAVVDKKRKIYFINNVKFHFDTVKDLGTFVEVEAIDKDGSIGKEKLQAQCDEYAVLFNIDVKDFASVSYSDMIVEKIIASQYATSRAGDVAEKGYAKRIADTLGVSLDYLVSEDAKDDALDKDAVKRIKDIQKLPEQEKEKVFSVIDALVRDFKTRKAYADNRACNSYSPLLSLCLMILPSQKNLN